MRKFSSYGPVDTDLHYYVPRRALVDRAFTELLGENPDKGGHYITIWAPRQRGKTWVMQQVLSRLRRDPQYGRFDALKINLEHLKMEKDVDRIVQVIAGEIIEELALENVTVNKLDEFYHIFKKGVLKKPLILIMDEFDALTEETISGIAGIFRNIYNRRRDDADKTTGEKAYLLHGVALIGVRAVLGIENVTGSPFNVQRSLHIPNLTFAEVESMFNWYERESGQPVAPEVIERLYYETQGQPGLVSWFGELLTETYNEEKDKPITMNNFDYTFLWATEGLGNANILNIISKARQEPYKNTVLELFKTDEKINFRYDDVRLNFLYLNGVIDIEETDRQLFVKFSCPFVQKRLFNYFSYDLFGYLGKLHEPFENLEDTITPDRLNIGNLIKRYERYLKKNRDWLLKDAPRRTDLRVYEAVYHFNLYMYVSEFLSNPGGQVYPEFPTGNGQIDLIIKYSGQVYGLEVKSYTDEFGYRRALKQAADYGQQLQLAQIWLVFFVEYVDEANRQKYEAVYVDEVTGVTVTPIFVETGS